MDVLQAAAIVVGLVSGVAGFVLGVLNYIHQRDTSRPRLRVRPRIMHIIDRDPGIGCNKCEKNVGVMEICNIGNVPVVGGNIGFLPKRKGEDGLIIVSPESVTGDQWPCEVKPGHLIMLRMDLKSLVNTVGKQVVGSAFVASAVGDMFHASRKEMKEFRASLQRVRPQLESAE